MAKTIKLTESELRNMIVESVKTIMTEAYSQYERTPYNDSNAIDADLANIEAAVERDREKAEIDNMVKKGWCTYPNIKEVLVGVDDDVEDDYDGLMEFPIITNDRQIVSTNIRGRSRYNYDEKTFYPDGFYKPLKLNKPMRNVTFAVGYGGSIDDSDEFMQLSIYVSIKKTRFDIEIVTDNPNINVELTNIEIRHVIENEAKRRYEEKVRAQRGR
jgi:hypothetical protein